jgi:hypothetical protein
MTSYLLLLHFYRVSVTSKCYKCTRIGGKRCNCSCFEIDQEMDAILLIIGIVYGICRIVIKSVQQCTYFLFSVNLLLVGVNYAVAPFPSDAHTFHNIYKLQKHVLLRHQSYLLVFMGNTNLRLKQLAVM